MIKKVVLENWKSHAKSEFEFGEGTNVLVGVSGSGKSLPYNEIILVKQNNKWQKIFIGEIVEKTLKKCKKIEKLENGTFLTLENPLNIKVQTLNSNNLKMKEKKISGFIKHLAPSKVLKITTRLGKEITITENHSMLSLVDGVPKPIKGSDLNVGDFVPCPKKMDLQCSSNYIDCAKILPEFRNTTNILHGLQLIKEGFTATQASKKTSVTKSTLANWRDRKITHTPELIIAKHLTHCLPTKIKLTKEFARLCGAYISGGRVYYSAKNRYKLHISNNNKKFLRTCQKDWKKTFPHLPVKIYKNSIQINSKVASALFLKLFGKNAGEKNLPPAIFWFTDELLSEFLQMYFEGDGYISKKAELSCSSKSIKLLDDIQTILCRFGIISKIRPIKRKQGTYYELHILIKHIPIFAKHVSFLSEKKQNTLNKVTAEIEKKKRWNRIDVIPNVENLLKNLTAEYSLGRRNNKKLRLLSHQIFQCRTKFNLGRDKLSQMLKEIENVKRFKTTAFKKLEKIAESEIFFDKIKKIEKINCSSEHVYDLAIKGTENFVAGLGNILTHNSAVMDAICFALYGTFPLANARMVKLEEVIMQKPVKRDSATISLKFDYNNKNFEVQRTINAKTSNQATLKESGRLIAGPKPNEVTKRIEEIIDVNYELFSRAIYAEQNQIDYFLKLNPAQRKEKLDDLLLINKYELVRANAVGMQNRLKKQFEDKKSLLKEIKERFDEKELLGLQKKMAEKKEEILKAKKEISELEEKIKKTNEKIISLEKKEKEFDFFKELLLKSQTKAQELEKIVLEAKSILKQVSPQELSKLKEQIEGGKKELEKEKIGLEKKEAQMQKQINEIMQKKGVLLEKTAQKEKQLQELTKAKSSCPICNRRLEEHTKAGLLAETKKEKEKVQKELEELEKNRTEISLLFEKNSGKLEKNSKESDLLGEKSRETSEKIKKAMELNKKEGELKTLLNETKKVREQLGQMGFSPQNLLNQRKALENQREKILVLKEQAKSSKEIIEQISQNEKRVMETKKQITEFEKNCKSLSFLGQQLTIFINTLKGTQAELRHSLINTVNEAMNDIWQNIYPYGDFESAKIGVNEIGNYDIIVKQKNGPWNRVEGILSGGERSCVALTLRIAVSLVLTQNLSWLILDEPTHNLDVNTVARLSQMMKNHLPGLVEQIFIITHDKEMENAATSSLYFLGREKDSGSPTKPVLQETR